MKHHLATAFAGILLLGGLVQARYLVVMDAGSSRTTAYLYSESGSGVELVHTTKSTGGGQSGVHEVFKDMDADFEKYFTDLLAPLAEKLRDATAPEIVRVNIYGTGGVRTLSKESQEKLWKHISDSIKASATKVSNELEFVQFRLADAKTISGEEEARLTMVAAQKKYGREKAVIDIGGASSQVALESTFKTFSALGAVRASNTVSEKLLPDGYDAAMKAVTDSYTEPRNKGAVLKEVGAGGRLEKWMGKTDHPCLMRASDPVDMVLTYNKVKSDAATYREVVPFRGTGDYEACLQTIEDHAFRGERFNIPKGSAVVGLRHLFFNEANLKNVELLNGITKVSDYVEAAKRVCAMNFEDLEEKYVQQQKSISPHGLVELCWSTTYSAAILTRLFGLDHDTDITLTKDIGWATGKVIELATFSPGPTQ